LIRNPAETDRRLAGADHRHALTIALIYAAIGSAWILATSGIPVLLLQQVKFADLPWDQAGSGGLVIFASSWMLYLLIKEKLEQARQSATQLRLRDRALEASTNAIVITDHAAEENPVVYVNPAFERITGYRSDEIVGQGCQTILGDEGQPAQAALLAAFREGREGRALLHSVRKDGSPFWMELHLAPVLDEFGRVSHHVAVQNDVTENVRYQQELEYQANHDTLTGLANRNLLRDRLDQAIAYGRRDRRTMAVAFIDLDNFKFVNDSQGHPAGDALLKQVAGRLAGCIRASDTVARMGGDEFVLLLFDQPEGPSLATTLDRILTEIAQPYRVGAHEFNLSCSIGCALFPEHGEAVETLLQRADIAMYNAKESGKNAVRTYSNELDQRFVRRVEIETDLRAALDQGQFFICYQPQVSAAGHRLIGVEALLRWRHPQRGVISPAHFIPVAEETGMIVAIGDWVLRQACADAMAWGRDGLPPMRVAVNLSARQFLKKDLVQSVADALAHSGLPPGLLELELTESLLMHNAELFIATLRDLKALGVELAVDDFGTGYSSLSYLKRFPVDRLKIDQSFVRELMTDTDSAAICQAVITLGHSLGLQVIAEGVESGEQAECLLGLTCDELQGYHFSKPVPDIELRAFARTYEGVATAKAI